MKIVCALLILRATRLRALALLCLAMTPVAKTIMHRKIAAQHIKNSRALLNSIQETRQKLLQEPKKPRLCSNHTGGPKNIINPQQRRFYQKYSELPIVVIAQACGNGDCCEKTLRSILDQQYSNFYVIYINDALIDTPANHITKIVCTHPKGGLVKIINNFIAQGSLANIYRAIHSCLDDSIVILVDAQNQFIETDLLAKINRLYATENIWYTYGSYENYQNSHDSASSIKTPHFSMENDHCCLLKTAAPLKTFYAWLFKRIHIRDLQVNDHFLDPAPDHTFMSPISEMAGGSSVFLQEIGTISHSRTPYKKILSKHDPKLYSAETDPPNTVPLPQKSSYLLTNDPIDVVIVCHPKDQRTLNLTIAGIKKNGTNIRDVMVISKIPLTSTAKWIPENIYPFTPLMIATEIFKGDEAIAKKFIEAPQSRIGWIYQQFLKLYAPFIIPHISPNVLILDADTIYLRKTTFMTQNNEPLFHTTTEYHHPYFVHGKKLIPWFRRAIKNSSGVSHHMLFQRSILQDLLHTIEIEHKKPAWKAICQCIDPFEVNDSSMSEYELYFNFVLLKTNVAQLRTLKHHELPFSLYLKDPMAYTNYDYVSCHAWKDDTK